ncbi:MAG: TVP38/TMEM64 family protein [Candidatus Omnitrophica bacterium]|nr:TVP38/TMEM64 family protein [Candidatus Omnitrophota bacterium]
MAAFAVVAYIGWLNRDKVSPEIIRAWISRFGASAPFVYALLYALNTVTLLPPIFIMSLTAGLAFGKVTGFLALMAGAMIGTSATFYISRRVGREFVEKRLAGKFKSLDERLRRNGFATVLFFRVIPLVPYEVLNYTAGLSNVSFKDYWWGTLIGLLPGVAAAVFFGDSLANIKKDPAMFLVAVGALALLFAVPVIYLKLKKKSPTAP